MRASGFGLQVSGVIAALVASIAVGLSGATQRFYDDDPIWKDDDTVEDASGVRPWKVPEAYDAYENSLGNPGDHTPDVHAQNLNTVDEVLDSSWFTNRIGRGTMTADEIARGPRSTSGPAPGTWVVISGKSDGVTPGFTVNDPDGQTWFLKFDPDRHPGMASGAEVVSSKLLWALGYHVPEYLIVHVRRDQLVIGEGAMVQPPGAYPRRMKADDLDWLLSGTHLEPTGMYHAVTSLALPGTPLGGFRFYGTRPDDPNDIVPHEHRRELRAYGVFAAWLNHVYADATNTLDTLIANQGRAYVRHHLLDFGSTLGSAAVQPREFWEGYDYLVNARQSSLGMLAFGFYILPWRTTPFYESPAVGRLPLDNASFDPERWKPRVPNPAFRRARADDKFWAARRLMALTDDLIRAAVGTGEFPDPAAEAFLAKALIERRDAIGRAYLPAINPVADPSLDGAGVLTFANAAVDAGFADVPERYRARWFAFENATGATTPLGDSVADAPRLLAPPGIPAAPGVFLKIEVSAESAARPTWAVPVHIYFRRIADGWTLVGFERTP